MLRRFVAPEGQEVVAVPHRLDEHERAIERQRDHSAEHELGRAEQRTGSTGRDVRHDERKDGERRQHRQCRARPLDLERLFVMAHAAGKQA